jgi:hypothetical protein
MGIRFATVRGRGFFPALAVVVLCCVGFAACPEPTPLLGSWADNMGNTLTFGAENSFSASISYSAGTTDAFQGRFTVLLNALTIDCTEPYALRVVTEWDIRGNMLYLTWTTVTGSVPLTLYKISN